MKISWAYILKCTDKSYYVGCTTNLGNRLNEHKNKKFTGYTSSRLPVELVFSQEFNHINDAIKAERKIKKWSRKKKEALISGDYGLLHKLSECRNDTHYKRFDSAQHDKNTSSSLSKTEEINIKRHSERNRGREIL